jgi:sodium-dependent dicarboxylate transporter 2/3/5
VPSAAPPGPGETGPAAGEAADAGGRRPRLIGLAAGPVLFALVLAWPLPELTREAHALAAVFVWAAVYWVTQAVPAPVTALLSSAACVVLGVAPARTVLASYGDPVIFLFIGSFILAEAMRASGLDRRVAYAVLRQRWATRTPAAVMGGLGLATCAISLWVSNTATTALMLPIGLGVLRELGRAGDPAQSRFPIGLLLMLTWASSVAVGTPVASPPNLIAIAMLRELGGRRVGFADWVIVTMPLTVLMLALCWGLLRVRYASADSAPMDIRHHAFAAREPGPWSRAERNVAAVFSLACLFWIGPGLLALVSSDEGPLPRFFETHLPESVVAILAAGLLFALPTDLRRGEFTLTWHRAAGIDWGTILLFGGGLALGRLLFDTGLAAVLGRAVVAGLGANDVWSLTAVAIIVGVVLSETSSNTAAASAVIPLVIAAASDLGVSPVPPVLGAALGASFGFMLPVSTPPNAIVYGSGLVPLREMIVSGFWLDVTGAILIWVGLRTLCPLVGLT